MYNLESIRLEITKLVFATETKHPLITDDTLIGTWEALSDYRVYRFEIKKSGKSFLAFADLPKYSWVYNLTKKKVKNGKVFLEFKSLNDKPETIIHIIGEGVAGKDGPHDEGGIIAKLIMDPNEKPLNVWNLTFIKGEYIKDLFEMSELAKKAIEKYNLQEKNKKKGFGS